MRADHSQVSHDSRSGMTGPRPAQRWPAPAAHGQVGRAQRPTEHGAQVLAVLAGRARLNGEVAAIVRARRDLVQQQPPVWQQEHLHAKHARAWAPARPRASGSPHRLPGIGRSCRRMLRHACCLPRLSCRPQRRAAQQAQRATDAGAHQRGRRLRRVQAGAHAAYAPAQPPGQQAVQARGRALRH